MLFKRFTYKCCGKPFCTVLKRNEDIYSNRNSKIVRKHFIDYFVNEHGHTFIPSSSVVPYLDPSLSFVNAGMCQFKNVFLGEEKVRFSSAANSQKCIRHNDFESIGDTYHHSFFEMLGSWSFGSYSKEKACKLAWDLLTQPPFSISPDRLFITYFGGDNKLSLPPDIETRDIWSKLGIPGNKILPFGSNENFWDMGMTGPCGPCTEIHIALTDKANSKYHLVNSGHPTFTELWNIVFISYDRDKDGQLNPLKNMYIDTGMGLERLVAVLQGQTSTYDTDLFLPLFDVISKVSQAPKYAEDDSFNRSYRILVDYVRMVTVAISDNVFPDPHNNIRRPLRKAMIIAENDFDVSNPAHLLTELSNYIAESLADAYPNIMESLPKIKHVLRYEVELWEKLKKENESGWHDMNSRCSELEHFSKENYPALPQAYNRILRFVENNDTNKFPAEEVFYLYNVCGLDQIVIDRLMQLFGLEVNQYEVTNLINGETLKEDDKTEHNSVINLLPKSVSKTNDNYKYDYERLETDAGVKYKFPEISTTIQAIVKGENVYDTEKIHKLCLNSGDEIFVITNETNFYSEAGGQPSDAGIAVVINENNQCINFQVKEVKKVENHVFHHLIFVQSDEKNLNIAVGDRILLRIDEERRLSHMRNHTIIHLLYACLKKLLPVTCVKSTRLNALTATFTFATFGTPFLDSDAVTLENSIKDLISSKLPVDRYTVSGFDLIHSPDITLNPHETYPATNVHVISILNNTNVVSKEACCGTHVRNTADIGDFCFTALQKTKSSFPSLRCVTGSKASVTLLNGKKYLDKLKELALDVEGVLNRSDKTFNDVEAINEKYLSFRKNYNKTHGTVADDLSLSDRAEIVNSLKSLDKSIKKELLNITRKEIEENLKRLLTDEQGERRKFLVHTLSIKPDYYEYVSLRDLINVCKDVPTLLFFYKKGRLRSACLVPSNLITDEFSAYNWMLSVCKAIKAEPLAARNAKQCTCFMVPLSVKPENVNNTIVLATEIATDIANRCL